MSEHNLAKFLKVAGGLALAVPALTACKACCAAKGACAAQSDAPDAKPAAGCGAVNRAAMAQGAAKEAKSGCCAAAQ